MQLFARCKSTWIGGCSEYLHEKTNYMSKFYLCMLCTMYAFCFLCITKTQLNIPFLETTRKGFQNMLLYTVFILI